MANYSKKRFLVIDDQPLARDALRTVAQTLGAFSVEFASNYQDAVYRIRNNTPDIILCDYMLGEGRSGQQLTGGTAALLSHTIQDTSGSNRQRLVTGDM